jgi:hypothetical protein
MLAPAGLSALACVAGHGVSRGHFIDRLIDCRQTVQPFLCVVGGDDRSPSRLSRPEPTRRDFLIGAGLPKTVAPTKIVKAHRPLPSAALVFTLADMPGHLASTSSGMGRGCVQKIARDRELCQGCFNLQAGIN